MNAMTKHKCQWGPWFHPTRDRVDCQMAGTYRFCINGYCSKAQYRNGREVVARPERKAN